MLLSVIIPCYNERATITALLRRVQAAPILDLAREIIVIDDGSTDGTRELLADLARRAPPFQLLLRPRNGGKGAALRDGFDRARGDLVLIQDADLEYDPDEYPRLLAPLLAGQADLVLGSRFLGHARRAPPLWHYMGNRGLSLLASLRCGVYLTDVHTCYKVMPRAALRRLPLGADDFTIDQEIVIHAARSGLRIFEVPVSYAARTRAEGKKLRLRDGLDALAAVVRIGRGRP